MKRFYRNAVVVWIALLGLGVVHARMMAPVIIPSYLNTAPAGGGGGGSYATFVASDTFTGNNGAGISTHTADTGQVYSIQAGAGTDMQIQTNKLRSGNSGAKSFFVLRSTPTTPNYATRATFSTDSAGATVPYIGVHMSSSASTTTGYTATCDNNTWKIARFVQGVEDNTMLGSSTTLSPNGVARVAELRVSSGATTVHLELLVGGTVIISTNDGNANRIQGTGFPGIVDYFSDATNARNIDDLSVWAQ